jgi:hypothetical protein
VSSYRSKSLAIGWCLPLGRFMAFYRELFIQFHNHTAFRGRQPHANCRPPTSVSAGNGARGMYTHVARQTTSRFALSDQIIIKFFGNIVLDSPADSSLNRCKRLFIREFKAICRHCRLRYASYNLCSYRLLRMAKQRTGKRVKKACDCCRLHKTKVGFLHR